MSQPRSSFKTSKGTELPLLNLRGREYLQVAHRIVWFREEHHDWRIETVAVKIEEDSALFRAVIKDSKGEVITMAHKFETMSGFPDFIEKAETGAIGRALALMGYGTQFAADELEEGERIVDSPTPGKGAPRPAAKEIARPATVAESIDEDPGEYVCQFGKKYYGQKVKDIPAEELRSYCRFLEKDGRDKLKGYALAFFLRAHDYLDSLEATEDEIPY